MSETVHVTPDGEVDVIYYVTPMLDHLHLETFRRIQTLPSPELAFWIGAGAAVTFFTQAMQSGDNRSIEAIGEWLMVAGKKIQKEQDWNLGYKS